MRIIEMDERRRTDEKKEGRKNEREEGKMRTSKGKKKEKRAERK
jgi:hypothetical protein